MKKTALIISLILLAFSAGAQDLDFITQLPDEFKDIDTVPRPQQYKSIHMLGVQYTFNISGVRANPSVNQKNIFTAKNFSILYTYYHALWDEMFNFGFEAGAKFGEEGYASPLYGYGEKCKIVEVPVLSQFKIDFSRLRILANIGPYVGYRLTTDKPEGFDKYDQRFDYGLIGGVGLGIVFKPFEIHIEGNYKWAFASMYHTNKYSDQYWMFAYPSNIMISVGLFYHLW